jgi:hypothetical protein
VVSANSVVFSSMYYSLNYRSSTDFLFTADTITVPEESPLGETQRGRRIILSKETGDRLSSLILPLHYKCESNS